MSIAPSASQKSTNVRSTLQLRALRTVFGLLDRAAPSVSGRWAAQIWCTVPRPARRSRTPGPPPGPAAITTTSIVTPTGIRIAVETRGSGPPVYLVHGWGGRRSQLTSFVAPLVDMGYAVVAHDAPSHGDSGPGTMGPRRTHGGEMVDALAAVVATFGRPHAIIGHSLGCAITAFAIADGLTPPPRLGFVAPTIGPVPHIHTTIQQLGASERTEREMLAHLATMLGRPVSDYDARLMPGPVPPTLIIHDGRDKEVPYAEAESLAEMWPSAELHRTDGLGHRRILRDPDVLKRVVDYVT